MTITTDVISPLSGGPASIPALRWQVWVNWSDDGIWGAKDVDISDDVLGLRWSWGRRGLPAPEFAAPAALELTLNNADHRYTPGNAGGPLGTNVRPGREVRLRASRLHDDFATSGAGSEDLDKRKTAFGNGSWEVISTAGNGFSVLAGEVRGAAGSPPPSDAVALLDTGDATATLTARYRRATNGQGGFVLRCVAANNCLRLRFDHTASVLERVAGSTVTQLASGSTLAAAAWHDLEIEQTADSVRVHAINLESGDRVGRTLLAASGIADPPDSGRHGLWHSFRNTADRWGGFGVGRGLFRGQVTDISPDYADGTCRIEAADVMQRLESVRLRRALSGGPMRSGNVAASILAWSGLAPGEYRLDSGRVLLTGGARSVWEVSAARALRRLQREEHGLIYTDGHGRVRLEAATLRSGIRAHSDPATLARLTVGDTAGGAGPYAANLRWDDGASATEDAVVFRYRRLADAGKQRVWNLNEPLAIDAGRESLVAGRLGSMGGHRRSANAGGANRLHGDGRRGRQRDRRDGQYRGNIVDRSGVRRWRTGTNAAHPKQRGRPGLRAESAPVGQPLLAGGIDHRASRRQGGCVRRRDTGELPVHRQLRGGAGGRGGAAGRTLGAARAG